MQLEDWALAWGIPHAAIADLRTRMGMDYMPRAGESEQSETAVQAEVRLDAARCGVTLFRNNVGALLDSREVPVRYGLANDSAKLNKVIKSGDLIGWRTIVIGPQHMGMHIAQFVSREVKHGLWRYGGTPHEEAQAAWANLVLAAGGDAGFCTGPGTL